MSSAVWKYFSKTAQNEAKCNVSHCKSKIFKLVNYGTSSMKKHLLEKHGIDIHKEKLAFAKPRPLKKQKTLCSMVSSVNREPRALLLSKCAAKDGFAVKKIVNSDACIAYLNSRNHQMPMSDITVWNEILMYHNELLGSLKHFVHDSKLKGGKFSLLVDEWTDISSKRYLNIILHNGTNAYQYSLAPVGVGSCNSFRLQQIVMKKLEDISLNAECDIVASTHDGASVMKKYGQSMPFEQQLCLNHCLNLSIIDVLYLIFFKKS